MRPHARAPTRSRSRPWPSFDEYADERRDGSVQTVWLEPAATTRRGTRGRVGRRPAGLGTQKCQGNDGDAISTAVGPLAGIDNNEIGDCITHLVP